MLARVPVPETSVNEYDLPTLAKNDIRFAREVLAVKSIAIAHSMQKSPDDHLWLRVAALDCTHGAAALFRRHRYVTRISVGSDCGAVQQDQQVEPTSSILRTVWMGCAVSLACPFMTRSVANGERCNHPIVRQPVRQ